MNAKKSLLRHYKRAQLAYVAFISCYPLTLDDLDGEVWKPIADYQGRYYVSNYGRVKSLYKGNIRILKPRLFGTYLFVSFCVRGKKDYPFIHRLVAENFLASTCNKTHVNHVDGVKFNNFVSNLEWVTASENTRHAFKSGLAPQGANRSQAKLTNSQVVLLRDNPDNLTQKQLSVLFNVSVSQVSVIQRGITYANAGGMIRGKIERRVPEEIRKQIRAEYKRRKRGHGSHELGRKYGLHSTTILDIVNGK